MKNNQFETACFGGRQALLLWVMALASAALLGSGCGRGERVLATVGERRITVDDFESAARRMPPSRDPAPAAKRLLLDDLVSRELLVDDAHRRGYGKGPEFEQAQRRAREEVLPERLYARVIGGRVRVSDAEARAIWKRQDREWRVSQIFVFTEGEARVVRDRLARGEAFSQVARTASRDATSAARGGDLGYLTAGQIPSEIERAIADLPPGKWKGPLATPIGLYFVQVTERRARKPDPFEAVSQTLQATLRQRKERQLVLDYVARLKQRYHLHREESSFAVLATKWQNRTTEEVLASGGDPRRLGFTDADLARPLAAYDGGAYTIRDFFADFSAANVLERPPGTDDNTLRIYVDDRAVSRLLLFDARQRGLDREPETLRALRDREDSFLITRLYEQVIVPSAAVTPADRERLRAALGKSSGIPGGVAQQLAALEERFAEAKRRQVLQEMLTKLRQEHPPRIDEKALAEVPWPVPAKENA